MDTALLSSPASAGARSRPWLYWIVTGLLVAFIGLGAALDVARVPDAIAYITHLGYPAYFVPFIGVLKLLGIAAQLLPGWPRLKEWAYAGLVFDTAGAWYSAVAVGDAPATWVPPIVGLALTVASYVLFRQRSARQPLQETR